MWGRLYNWLKCLDTSFQVLMEKGVWNTGTQKWWHGPSACKKTQSGFLLRVDEQFASQECCLVTQAVFHPQRASGHGAPGIWYSVMIGGLVWNAMLWKSGHDNMGAKSWREHNQPWTLIGRMILTVSSLRGLRNQDQKPPKLQQFYWVPHWLLFSWLWQNTSQKQPNTGFICEDGPSHWEARTWGC